MIDNLFLCVGAQKAGTTWLHSQLSSHSQITFTNVKEIHYFNTIHNGSILLTQRKVEHIERLIKNNKFALMQYFTNLSRGLPVDEKLRKLLSPVDDKWYCDLFKDKKGIYAADFSPEYALIGEEGFRHVRRLSQNRKIVFIMRDPISRAASAIRYFYKTKGTDISVVPIDEMTKLAETPTIIQMSSYGDTITHLDKVFDGKDVKYLFYEDMMSNKQEHIEKITTFLEINNIKLSESSLEKRVNETESFELPLRISEILAERLTHVYDEVSNRFKYVPKSWRYLS
ncbi:MAG: sulfotransferase [Nitrospira sp.]|nr:sulfotransferase [Nitrospira sp.]